MPEATVAAVPVTEPKVEAPEPKTEVTEKDLDTMSLSDLENLVKTDKPVTPVKSGAAAVAPKEGDTKWVEIDVPLEDDAKTVQKLRFKTEEDFRKSFAHGQKLIRTQKAVIDRYNAERSQVGDKAKQYEDAITKVSSLEQQIKDLTSGATAVARGQTPNATTQDALAAIRARNGGQGQDALLTEIEALKNTQSQWQAKIERLEALEEKFNSREAELVVNNGVQSLYTEVSGFQNKHPEYKTDEDFAKLDDLVSTQGEEVARTMMSEQDWQKYEAVMQVVGLYKNNPSGQFDLSRKNYKDLEISLLVHQHETGSLGNALAEAQKNGMKNYEQALQRGAQSATVLPNSQASSQTPVMGQAEIESILDMDPAVINANPELKKKFEEAAKALGINLVPGT